MTCSLKLEHPGCAENQALVNHRYSVERILLHALVKYMIQPALQHTFAYTWYNRVFWALLLGWMFEHGCSDACCFGSHIHVLYYFFKIIFSLVQRSLACFTRKGADLEIQLLSLLLLLLLLLLLSFYYYYHYY